MLHYRTIVDSLAVTSQCGRPCLVEIIGSVLKLNVMSQLAVTARLAEDRPAHQATCGAIPTYH